MPGNLALVLFRSISWVDGVYCSKFKFFKVQNRGEQSESNRYSCTVCGNNFSNFINTLFEYSNNTFWENM